MDAEIAESAEIAEIAETVVALGLSEDEEAIRKTARDVVQRRMPIAHVRQLRDTRDPVGLSREAWGALASLGLGGACIPESLGGGGLGYQALGLVLEECGRTLAPTPLLSTIGLCGSALVLGGSDAQKREHLPAMCAGERLLAFAHEESHRHAPHLITTRAERSGSGFVIHGQKSFVLDGHIADALVVAARTGGGDRERAGIRLFIVPARARGVAITRLALVDSRNCARVALDGVWVGAEAAFGDADVLDGALDRATALLSAEMLGGLQETFDRTIAYLKVRKQFGVPIGSFQALQHRAAHLSCEIELCRSIVRHALGAADEARNGPDLALAASAAKARASDAFIAIANEAVQMHGGIGVTDDLDIGLFLKRARVAELTLGDSAWHRDRFGRLSGY